MGGRREAGRTPCLQGKSPASVPWLREHGWAARGRQRVQGGHGDVGLHVACPAPWPPRGEGGRGPRLRMGLSGEDALNQGAGSGAGVQPRGPPAARMATLPATRCGTAENTVWVKTRLFQTEPAPGLWRWLRVSSSRRGSCSSAEKTPPRGLVSPVDRGTVPGKRTLREEKGDLPVLKWGWGDRLALLFYKITEHTPFFLKKG